MQYILIMNHVFRVIHNKNSIDVGHRVVNISTELMYTLRRPLHTNVYLLERVGVSSDRAKVECIKPLLINNPYDRQLIVTNSSAEEYKILLDQSERRTKSDYVFDECANDFVDYDYSIENRKRIGREPVLATHPIVQKMRDVLELHDDAVEMINRYAHYRKLDSNEYPIPVAELHDIIRIRVESVSDFDKFIKQLVKYTNVKYVQSVACRYCTNSSNDKKENFRVSNVYNVGDVKLTNSDYDNLFVQFELTSFSNKPMVVSFRIGFTIGNIDGNDIVRMASKLTGNQRNYEALGIEQFIDQCKTRVLGDRYNPELQYTKLDGVL